MELWGTPYIQRKTEYLDPEKRAKEAPGTWEGGHRGQSLLGIAVEVNKTNHLQSQRHSTWDLESQSEGRLGPPPDYAREEHLGETVLQSITKFLLTKEAGLDAGQAESSAVYRLSTRRQGSPAGIQPGHFPLEKTCAF